MLPARWALRGRRAAIRQAIETLDDAVVACQHTGLVDWALVTFAQQLVHRKFVHYSCRNLWDTPAQAFRYGMGYCTQYNLALKQILDRLGVATQAVTCLRIRVPDAPDWSMGHTWMHVRVQGEVRDVCAGHAENLPGQVNFSPIAPVWPVSAPVLFLLHLGMIPFCGYLEWRTVITGAPLPAWMFQERT